MPLDGCGDAGDETWSVGEPDVGSSACLSGDAAAGSSNPANCICEMSVFPGRDLDIEERFWSAIPVALFLEIKPASWNQTRVIFAAIGPVLGRFLASRGANTLAVDAV